MLSPLDLRLYQLFAGMPISIGKENELRKILKGSYSCSRVWEAWQYGTMSEDDFHPLEEDENIYNDINSLYNEPHLHNVFRMIIQNEYRCEIKKRYDIPGESFDKGWRIEIWDGKFLASIPYSPSLPLLEQEDTTKSQILDIFSNN